MMLTDLTRVLGLWRARSTWLWSGAIVAVLATLAGVALLALAGRGVSEGLRTGALTGIAVGSLLLLRPLIFVRPASRYLERLVTHSATFRALADTRIWFFRRLAERLPGGIGHRGAGDLLGRLVADVEALDGLYLRALVPGVAALAVVVAVAVLLGFAGPGIAVLVALPLALALLLPPLLAPGAARAAGEVAEAQGALRRAAVDPLLGLEDVLAANAEPRAAARLAESGATLAETQKRLARRAAWGGAAGSLLAQSALFAALGYGLAGGPGAVGGTIIGLFLALAAGEALAGLPRAGAALAAAGASARRLFDAADTPPPVAEPTTPAEAPRGHALRAEGVRFAWAADREPVFTELNFDLPEGGRLALLGPSGAGKSTLAALLLKLAAPQEGRLLLGGVDIAELPADAVRARIACLTQDARLFDDSIAANLRLAAPEADDAALWQALDRAGVADVVRVLPEGLATRCGEGGARFSGGQGRRLALARALLAPADILILDEPGAGLDPEAERAFLETLETATAGRSVILIAHRLLGVERPTRILRLIGGRAMAAMG
ncbi:thiol reductant ABC exporter subunit CydC [Pseudoroseomonas deserti]|uniref:Thiol reductant ABC exporter subunit CydC n=1 Tax=Teichococcus deserti TaxID=1817963 RepID=A0A1V2HAN1_9PROT|nr:thiol reductant ABC exporter subunit CydC [Pseudoroseomonas deserti]ONG58998.1 thiol reductant ABC exporter subunit CydC [Pseudoroseomonas deserti]